MLLILSVALLFVHSRANRQLKRHFSEMKDDVVVMDDGKNG